MFLRMAVVLLAIASLPINNCDPTRPSRPTLALGDGLVYRDVVLGSGALVDTGQVLEVHYTLFLSDGKKVDSSLDRGEPFVFTVGTGQVIAGWDRGLPGMRVGGRRLLIIPPELAYGAVGVPGKIPPNASIVTDVAVLSALPPAAARTAEARRVRSGPLR